MARDMTVDLNFIAPTLNTGTGSRCFCEQLNGVFPRRQISFGA
jgi:hypothetical protein